MKNQSKVQEPERLGFLNAFKPASEKKLSSVSYAAEWAHNYAFTLMNTEVSYDFLYSEAMHKIKEAV